MTQTTITSMNAGFLCLGRSFDNLISLETILELRTKHPQLHVTVYCYPNFSEIFTQSSLVNEVVTVLESTELELHLSTKSFAYFFNLTFSIESAVTTYGVNAQQKFGFLQHPSGVPIYRGFWNKYFASEINQGFINRIHLKDAFSYICEQAPVKTNPAPLEPVSSYSQLFKCSLENASLQQYCDNSIVIGLQLSENPQQGCWNAALALRLINQVNALKLGVRFILLGNIKDQIAFSDQFHNVRNVCNLLGQTTFPEWISTINQLHLHVSNNPYAHYLASLSGKKTLYVTDKNSFHEVCGRNSNTYIAKKNAADLAHFQEDICHLIIELAYNKLIYDTIPEKKYASFRLFRFHESTAITSYEPLDHFAEPIQNTIAASALDPQEIKESTASPQTLIQNNEFLDDLDASLIQYLAQKWTSADGQQLFFYNPFVFYAITPELQKTIHQYIDHLTVLERLIKLTQTALKQKNTEGLKESFEHLATLSQQIGVIGFMCRYTQFLVHEAELLAKPEDGLNIYQLPINWLRLSQQFVHELIVQMLEETEDYDHRTTIAP